MAMTAEAGELAGLAGIIDAVAAYLAGLDLGCVSGDDAARLTEVFARGERLCATGKALAARRAADCSAHERAGARSAEEWLAGLSGSSQRAAQGCLATAEQMEAAPELAEACKAGELSAEKAAEVADATRVDPSSARRLIESAKTRSLRGVREDCRAVRNAARSRQEDQERLARIHRGRYLRTWVDREGAGCGSFRMTPDNLARLAAALHPFQQDVYDQSRQAGIREKPECYALDALLALADAANAARADGPSSDTGRTNPVQPAVLDGLPGEQVVHDEQARDAAVPVSEPRKVGPPATIIVLIDHAALVRGYGEPGECCVIDGIGPVPVATIQTLLADAFMAAVVRDGVDIRSVVHLGRDPTARQRTALIARDRTCVVPGCDVSSGLEIDHVTTWVATHHTTLDELARLCGHHHALKSYDGWSLTGTPGHWNWQPPLGGVPPGPFDDDGLDLRAPPGTG